MFFQKSFLWLFFFTGYLFASDIIDPIQKAWSETKSYRADFQQIVVSKTLGTKEESRGTLFVKKPLKLRWETTSGGSSKPSLQILNGTQFWQVKPHKRKKVVYVDHYSNISKLINLGALTFLAGNSDLKKSYQYKVLQNTPKNVILALSPRGQNQDTILAEFLKPGYVLGALKQESLESETQITFQNVQTNLSLEEALFNYKADPQDIVVNHE